MNAIKATWKNGQVLLEGPANWPEGTPLLVEPLTREEFIGLREEDWPETPEAKAEWLKWYDSLELSNSPRKRRRNGPPGVRRLKTTRLRTCIRALMGSFHETLPPRHRHDGRFH